jgi:hypothetical protein
MLLPGKYPLRHRMLVRYNMKELVGKLGGSEDPAKSALGELDRSVVNGWGRRLGM